MAYPRSCDHEAVLALWAAGARLREIAAAVGRPRTTVEAIVRRARRKGDARAARRYLAFLPLRWPDERPEATA